MLAALSPRHLWTRWWQAPTAVFAYVSVAIGLAGFIGYAAFANDPSLTLPMGHTLSPLAAIPTSVGLLAIAIGLLNMQSWARVAHLLHPVWYEAVIFLDQEGIPKPAILAFDVAAGLLWIAIYWYAMFHRDEAKDWFNRTHPSLN